jgi:threonyl-tRNA synthetase
MSGSLEEIVATVAVAGPRGGREQREMAEMVKVTLPDDSVLEVPRGTTVREMAERIGAGLARATVGGKVDGELVDQRFAIERDCAVEILTAKSPESLYVLRHSAAHLMAMAVKRVRPEAHLAFGPALEDGFYYDFDVAEPFKEEDFAAIEEEMGRIVAEDAPFERYECEKTEAREILEGMGEDLKVEHLSDIEDERVSFYRNGDFQDLCEGPHLLSTGEIRAFKLLKTSSAYWKADAANRSLSRIYGTAFFDEKALDEHLRVLAEVKKRDHRRLGVDLDLFSFHGEARSSARRSSCRRTSGTAPDTTTTTATTCSSWRPRTVDGL